MGYCYSEGKLCCDICGTPGARKYPCPFGYCQPIAACQDCHKKEAEIFSKAGHRKHGCEAAHIRFEAEKAERAALISSGFFCLRAAMGVYQDNEDTGIVQVIFEGPNGAEQARYMPKACYSHITGNETIEDFERKHGAPLPVAPVDFHTKQVSVSELLASIAPQLKL